ncbi:DcaP family trimeric outer membrane transporter [Flavitalea antarctica]
MRTTKRFVLRLSIVLLPVFSCAQEKTDNLELYGFILVDGGYNFNSIDPDWFDVMRPTKLPKYKNQFGTSGNYFVSVRQTRFGVRSSTQTKLGELKTQFDFDLYGFGKDAGQTTIHLVNGFAQMGKLLVGQTPSTIMDTDVFPVTLDYWGPCSRIFILNVQVRYTPVFTEKHRFAVGLERPGATADGYDYTNSVDSRQLKPRLPLPNLTAHYRRNWNWGYTRIAAIAKSIQWKNVSDTSSIDLSGKDIGWGVNVSTVIDITKKLKFKFQGEWGEGFQNHIADPSPDVALESNPSDPVTPAKGKALPVLGFFSFVEYKWSKKLHSSVGYSMMEIKNADLQSPDAFRMGQYALCNLRYYAVENVMLGIEYQYGRRDNYSDGFHSVCHKIQFAFKCNFSRIFTAE